MGIEFIKRDIILYGPELIRRAFKRDWALSKRRDLKYGGDYLAGFEEKKDLRAASKS